MSDQYQAFTASAIGRFLANNLGLPQPTRLERYTPGAPLVNGTVAVGGRGRLAESLPGILDVLGIASTDAASIVQDGKLKGLVFDATGITTSAELSAVRDFFSPLMRRLEKCPRAVVIGTPPELRRGQCRAWPSARSRASPAASARRSGRAAPSQLVYVAEGAEERSDQHAGASCSPPSPPTSRAR